MSGETPPLIGKLHGHRRHSTTERYVHLADYPTVSRAKLAAPLERAATMLAAGDEEAAV